MRYQTLALILIASVHVSGVIAQERPSIPVQPMVEQVQSKPLTEEQVPATRQNKVNSPPKTIDTVYEQAFPPVVSEPAARGSFIDEVMKRWKPTQHYSVSPKDSIMVPVGKGLMNTFSTNLTMLTAKTNDESSTYEINEGYLYVTVNTEAPISIVMYEEGVLESQVSVTLVPVSAPPTLVEMSFNLTDEMRQKAHKYKAEMELNAKINTHAPTLQTQNSYQQHITSLLLPVAAGDIPRGFALSPSVPDKVRYPCSMTIFHEAKQRLISGKFVIDVVHVINNTDSVYQVREEMCLARYVKAVGLFEKAYLQPGEESELYILRDKFTEEKDTRRNRRPRLIGTGE